MHPDIERLRQLANTSVSSTAVCERDPLQFPIEALPLPLRRYCEEKATALPVPVDLVAVPALVCAGAAIGASRAIRLKRDWIERPALYAALVSPTSSLKTPALSGIAAPIRERQVAHGTEFQDALKRYETQQAKYAVEMEAYRKGKADEPPERPDKPIRARTWTADVTTERLATLLSENPRGVIIIRDELSAWVKSLNQYKGGKGSDKQFFLSAWSGEAVAVDRQGKDPILIDHPFLSVVGCIPPDVLPDLDDQHGREDGFIHRVLFSYPEPVPVRWSEATLSDQVEEAYQDLFDRLYALPLGPEGKPITLELTREARSLFTVWHDEHCIETESSDLPPGLRGGLAKLKGYCARLALIHALCTDPDAAVVDRVSVAAAADLVDYFKAHAEKVAPFLVRKTLTKDAQCEKVIRRQLAGGKTLTRRDLQRNGNSEAEVFNRVFAAMLQADQLEAVEPQEKRAPCYRLAEDVE